MPATIFEWDKNRDLLVVFKEEGGEALILKDPDGYPTLLGKFGTYLPEWQRKIEILDAEGLTLVDYFNHIDEVFGDMPSRIPGWTWRPEPGVTVTWT